MIRKRTRVANIIEEGRFGGPQIRIAEVAKILREEEREKRQACGEKRSDCEIETTVIFPKYESRQFRERLDAYEIAYIQFPFHRLGRGCKIMLAYALWFPIEIFLLVRTFKKSGFDVVHVSGGSWQIKGVIAGKLAGCVVLWHLNDTLMPGIIRFLFRVIAAWCADGFIVAGERVRKYYVDDLGFGDSKPVFEIQAPVNCAFFDPKNVNPEEKMVAIDALRVVSVGNVSPVKGFDNFMEMAELLNQTYQGLHFYIVGSHWASQKDYLRKLEKIKSDKNLYNLTFYGPCSDVRRIHKAADIYVCSSLTEASPISVWEAMAMQKPIVATNVGDIIRFIAHGENGYIVPPADPEALAYHVGKLVENKNLRVQFGRKARLAALENLDISIVVKRHGAAYRWAAGRRQKTEDRRQREDDKRALLQKQ